MSEQGIQLAGELDDVFKTLAEDGLTAKANYKVFLERSGENPLTSATRAVNVVVSGINATSTSDVRNQARVVLIMSGNELENVFSDVSGVTRPIKPHEGDGVDLQISFKNTNTVDRYELTVDEVRTFVFGAAGVLYELVCVSG